MGEKKVKLMLSENSSDSEENFHVNEEYANKYDKWRHSEELQKLKAKYGDSSPSSSSSSESEDENANMPLIEKDFLKTLSLLKSKNPKIYDENQNFFTNVTEPDVKPKAKKVKPLYFKDYERKKLLETNGKLDSEDDDYEHNYIDKFETYAEEQKRIKESFKETLAESDSEESDADLFQIRKKDHAEKEKDEADYIQWLKGEKDLPKAKADEDLEYLHDYWNNPDLDNDEQFLKNYILNKQFMENNNDDEIPSYDEIINDASKTFSDDEDTLKKQEIFEHKYNFRFEEPDSEFIKQYPRTIGDSLRRVDNKRKFQRENYQERKRREKEQKKEEIKRLKALKRIEIENMLNKLKETTGNDQLGFDYTDIDGDFDPDEHDKKMKELFNDEYYDLDETDKPQFPSDEEIDYENWDNWTGDDQNASFNDNLHCEDPNFIMDADYNPKLEFQKQMIESHSKKGKKKRRKSKFAEALLQPKPVFDPSEKTLEQYVDDYYKLDFEDVVGGEVFRFKYRSVIPNNFGLSTNEIFNARDKELNKWCSLKKTCQHRSEEEEKYDITAYSKKANNLLNKQKILPSLFENAESQSASLETSSDKISKKQKRQSNVDSLLKNNAENECDSFQQSKRIKLERDVDDIPNVEISEIKPENVQQFNTSQDNSSTSKKKRKKKKKAKRANNNNVIEDTNTPAVVKEETDSHCNSSIDVIKKKKKKKKFLHTNDNTQDQRNDSASSSKSFNKKSSAVNMKSNFKFTKNEDKRLQLSDARLKAYGVNPKKFKNRIKYSALNKTT